MSYAAKELAPKLGLEFKERNIDKSGSKYEEARQYILQNYQTKTRKQMIQELVTNTRIKSEASASIHICKIAKNEGLTIIS